jgi:hypothetical protein
MFAAIYGCCKTACLRPTSHSGCSQLFTWVTIKSLLNCAGSNLYLSAASCGLQCSRRREFPNNNAIYEQVRELRPAEPALSGSSSKH